MLSEPKVICVLSTLSVEKCNWNGPIPESYVRVVILIRSFDCDLATWPYSDHPIETRINKIQSNRQSLLNEIV